MRIRIGGFVVACALLGLAAPSARAQYYEVPQTDFTAFLSHPRYEDGGFFVAMEFLWWQQSKVIREQAVGTRGFYDFSGAQTGTPGFHIGSNQIALDTSYLGPMTFTPGWALTMGWRFESGVSVQASWYHLQQAAYSAFASTIPPAGRQSADLADTFISAPVFNFPPEFAGANGNIQGVDPGVTYGVWNAATSMQLLLVQRFEYWDIGARIPMWQTDTYRTYGLMGAKHVSMWERFKWRTNDADPTGGASNETVADYFNVVSNQLYGPHMGGGAEWYMGSTPIGAFSVSIDGQAGLYFDFANVRASYVRADQLTGASRHRRLSSLVPGVDAKASLWWYPWEAIQCHVGFDGLAFFNTVGSPKPVDFNFGELSPHFEHGLFRYLYGFSFGIGFVF
jgi:hypothetical protein